LRTFETQGHAATIWPLADIINYVYSHPFIIQHFLYTTHLDIIHHMDKYPQGSQSTYTETYTFHNLSQLCKTLPFQFLSVLTHVTSHSPHLKSVLHANNRYIPLSFVHLFTHRHSSLTLQVPF
jgi:hypothetical protein